MVTEVIRAKEAGKEYKITQVEGRERNLVIEQKMFILKRRWQH